MIIEKKIIATVGFVLVICGCSSEVGEQSYGSVENDEEEVPFDGHWLGYELGIAPGDWEELGPLPRGEETIIDGAQIASYYGNPSEEANSEEYVEYDIADLQHNRLYRVRSNKEDVGTISTRIGGYTIEGDRGDVPDSSSFNIDDEGLIEKSFSNGTDDREIKGIGHSGYTKSTFPYRTIGQLNGFCTGTMISCRNNNTICYVLTAAHCMFNSQGQFEDDVSDVYFSPRRDDNKGCGNKCAGAHPYGRWPVVNGYYLTKYLSDKCYNSTNDTCHANDIMVLKVTKCSNCTFPGTIGRTVTRMDDIEQYSKWHRGYRSDHNLWGDGALTTGDGKMKDGSWARLISHSSDSMPGHSGGPVYVNKNGNYYLFGVHVAGNDCGNNCGSHPNIMRRLDPKIADTINHWVTL